MTRPDDDRGRNRLRDKRATAPPPPLDDAERSAAFVQEGKDLERREDHP